MTARQRLGTIEKSDVVQPQEAPGEDVFPIHVLAIDPPGEVDQQLLKAALEEIQIALQLGARHLIHPPTSPRVDRRVHIAKVPFVGGDLPAWVHVPLAQD